ncbi:MAG: bifunctional serine/threonine-protein kinase/formylglycine-generating enzyme family protein, partial [Planctomycetota bacterium]
VKPSNLMISQGGKIKLLDLGLANFESNREKVNGELTDETTILGSLDYMAPEQACDIKKADARSDIYGLGCTLYALLTGAAPFSGDKHRTTQQKLVAHACEPRPDCRDLRDEIPENLSDLVKQMMATEPLDRPQSAQEVAKRLEAFFEQDKLGEHSKVVSAPKVALGVLSVGLIMLFGVILIIRFKDGTEKRIELPEVSSIDNVAVEGLGENGAITLWEAQTVMSSDWPDSAPDFAGVPFTGEQAVDYQKEWSEYLQVNVETKNSIGLPMRTVPPGTFEMGTSPEFLSFVVENWEKHLPKSALETSLPGLEAQAHQHPVKLTNALSVSAYLVQVEDYKQITGKDLTTYFRKKYPKMPEEVDTSKCPVRVRFSDAIEFCNALSAKEGLEPYYAFQGANILRRGGTGYRLPTEAEWEFICRSGSPERFWNDGEHMELSDYAWFRANRNDSDYYLRPVGQKLPNGFGIHDMLGSTAEWCFDFYGKDWYQKSPEVDPSGPPTGRHRSWRSGGDYSSELRISAGTRSHANNSGSVGGIRLVRTLLPK